MVNWCFALGTILRIPYVNPYDGDPSKVLMLKIAPSKIGVLKITSLTWFCVAGIDVLLLQ